MEMENLGALPSLQMCLISGYVFHAKPERFCRDAIVDFHPISVWG